MTYPVGVNFGQLPEMIKVPLEKMSLSLDAHSLALNLLQAL